MAEPAQRGEAHRSAPGPGEQVAGEHQVVWTWWPVDSSSGTTTEGSAGGSTSDSRGSASSTNAATPGISSLTAASSVIERATWLPAGSRVPCATVTNLIRRPPVGSPA